MIQVNLYVDCYLDNINIREMSKTTFNLEGDKIYLFTWKISSKISFKSFFINFVATCLFVIATFCFFTGTLNLYITCAIVYL